MFLVVGWNGAGGGFFLRPGSLLRGGAGISGGTAREGWNIFKKPWPIQGFYELKPNISAAIIRPIGKAEVAAGDGALHT